MELLIIIINWSQFDVLKFCCLIYVAMSGRIFNVERRLQSMMHQNFFLRIFIYIGLFKNSVNSIDRRILSVNKSSQCIRKFNLNKVI